MQLSSLSTESVKIPVSETLAGVKVDTTAYPVEMALVSDTSEPTVSDWHAATWETNSLTGEHEAVLIVGPGGTITLVKKQSYRPWVRITAPSEVPVLRCPGLIRAT